MWAMSSRLQPRRCVVPAHAPLYHEVREQIMTQFDPTTFPLASAERLALLVTGILAARSCVLAQFAAELDQLALTTATKAESIGRRLRRTLNDPHLDPVVCYAPVLRTVLDWPALPRGSRRVVLIVDESSKEDEIHRFRVSLAYWGGSLPLGWAVWAQNVALPPGTYWAFVDGVLAQVAALLPPEVAVVALADCVFAVPNCTDRLDAVGWHWVVRVQTGGSHRFRDRQGREEAPRDLVARHLPRPGTRWRATGEVFQDAGWRPVNLVGVWGAGAKEPLVVLTDLPPRWEVLRWDDRRFWIEAGF